MLRDPYATYGQQHESRRVIDLPRICYDIRDRFPVSGIALKAGVKLNRAGNEWKGCCPFHPDRTPSFTIYADDRRFQCFGCGAEGDVLDFVQGIYGAKLLGAIEMLDGGALRELEQQRLPAKPKQDMRRVAQRIVDASVPIGGHRRRRTCDHGASSCRYRIPYASRGWRRRRSRVTACWRRTDRACCPR